MRRTPLREDLRVALVHLLALQLDAAVHDELAVGLGGAATAARESGERGRRQRETEQVAELALMRGRTPDAGTGSTFWPHRRPNGRLAVVIGDRRAPARAPTRTAEDLLQMAMAAQHARRARQLGAQGARVARAPGPHHAGHAPAAAVASPTTRRVASSRRARSRCRPSSSACCPTCCTRTRRAPPSRPATSTTPCRTCASRRVGGPRRGGRSTCGRWAASCSWPTATRRPRLRSSAQCDGARATSPSTRLTSPWCASPRASPCRIFSPPSTSWRPLPAARATAASCWGTWRTPPAYSPRRSVISTLSCVAPRELAPSWPGARRRAQDGACHAVQDVSQSRPVSTFPPRKTGPLARVARRRAEPASLV